MTFKEFVRRWSQKARGIDDFISTKLGDDIGREASDAIRKRVVGSGTNNVGGGFSPYKSKSHLKKRKAKGLGSKKNFSFTGGMMDSLSKLEEKKTKTGTIVTIGVKGINTDGDRTKKRNKKNEFIEGVHSNREGVHSNREGVNVIDISDKELEEIGQKLVVELERYLDVT